MSLHLLGACSKPSLSVPPLSMRFVCRAMAALLFSSVAIPALAADASGLTLTEASNRMLTQHPQLTQFVGRFQMLAAEHDLSAQSAPLSLGLATSDIAGSGNYSGLKSAETTLSLASVFESRSKRSSRQSVVAANREMAEAEQQTQVLVLLSGLTQQFVKTLATQERCALNQDAAALSAAAVKAVQERVQKAAAAEIELARAKVTQLQADVALANCRLELEASYQELALAMGQQEADFTVIEGELFQLPQGLALNQIKQKLQQSPFLQLYNKQRDAQLAKVDSLQKAGKTDIQWRLDAIHFAETDDFALGIGIEIPLFSGRRNTPAVRAARAQMDVLTAQQQVSSQQLYAELYSQVLQYQQARALATRLQTDAVPLLQRAYQQARSAYIQGRYSYSEWMGVAQELLASRQQIISASENALLLQARIEATLGTSALGAPNQIDL